MEINQWTDVRGVVTTEAIPEGRMVLITSHSETHNFGSREDLPGIKLPEDATEAARALYVAAFAEDNRSLPLISPMPDYAYNLRNGWGNGANNSPITGATIYLTHPGNMVGQTIPSGEPALAYAGGVFTVPSGAYVHSADLEVPDAGLEVLNVADDTTDAGKLSYATSNIVARVVKYDAVTGALQFRTIVP